jgi:sulfide:quinone oxidoreductase
LLLNDHGILRLAAKPGEPSLPVMTTSRSTSEPFHVVIAGGGVAGLETALALRAHADDRVDITFIAPEREFLYRPMTVREPFAMGKAHRYQMADIAADIGAQLVEDSFGWVDAPARVAHTKNGASAPYDALVLALGARPHARFEHTTTIDPAHLDETLHGLIQDIEGQYVRSVAFVAPGRMGWPLPLYELALMTARRAFDMNIDLRVTVVTPEDSPLAIFGRGASEPVSKLLDDAGVAVIASAYAQVPSPGHVAINPGGRQLRADRIVALPELYGPAVRGLSEPAAHGFIPVDVHGRVRRAERIYAAGDATDFAIKHGGIAAQQADAVAESIAALAGEPIQPTEFRPVIHGMLLTGAKPLYLTARITGGHGFSSQISDTPNWSPPAKIAARYLAPYLDQRDRVAHPLA